MAAASATANRSRRCALMRFVPRSATESGAARRAYVKLGRVGKGAAQTSLRGSPKLDRAAPCPRVAIAPKGHLAAAFARGHGAALAARREPSAWHAPLPILPLMAAARARATLGSRHREGTGNAAVATRAVRYSARDLLPQRRLLEPAADRDASSGARRRRAQGAALADRSGVSRRAIRTRPPRRG